MILKQSFQKNVFTLLVEYGFWYLVCNKVQEHTHKERGSESIQFLILIFHSDILFRSLHHWTSVCMWARAREMLTDALSGVTDMLHCCYHLVGWLELKAGRWPLWNYWLKWRLGDLSLLKTVKEAKGKAVGERWRLFDILFKDTWRE